MLCQCVKTKCSVKEHVVSNDSLGTSDEHVCNMCAPCCTGKDLEELAAESASKYIDDHSEKFSLYAMIIEMHESLLGKVDKAAAMILQQVFRVCQSRSEAEDRRLLHESQV